jgi:TolB-like protein
MAAWPRFEAGVLLVAITSACAPSMRAPTPAMLAADSAVRAALAVEASLDPAVFPQYSIGVLPLRVVSADPTLEPLGHGLAELLMTDLARSSRLIVVDRLRVQALLRELALGATGVVDQASSPRMGRIIGARHLLLGDLTVPSDEQVHVAANLARTEDATVRPIVEGAATIDDILAAEKAVAFRVFEALGVTLTPAERAAVEQRPTRSLAALLAFSRGVRAEGEGRFMEARVEYRDAVRLDPSFGLPAERLTELVAHLPDTFGVGLLSLNAINRPHLRPVSDVTEPAFAGEARAVLIIPIIVR